MEGDGGLVFICNVSGAIGVGKDTLLEVCREGDRLKKALAKQGVEVDVDVLYEPKEMWRDKGWLDQFYSDPVRYAFVFQQMVFFTAISNVQQKLSEISETRPPAALSKTGELAVVHLLLVERGIFDQLCFWHVQVDSGRTLDMEKDVYEMSWSRWRSFVPAIDAFLLLRSGETAEKESVELVKRVNIRAKRYELKVSRGDDKAKFIEYEKRLQEKHLEFFTEPLAFPPHHDTPDGIPCRHIRTQDIPYHDPNNQTAKNTLVSQIAQFLHPLIEKKLRPLAGALSK